MFGIELAILGGATDLRAFRRHLEAIAKALLDRVSMPSIREHEQLLRDVLSDQWWSNLTLPTVEGARRALGGIVSLVR